eukprot:CAMPEP_0194322742 /NCGR_PEP_ID=MMETSP0171-20130528/22249_1 /TAXON_ID=218684 /ORGANISM="Corethron pennatum, Strain L29A3" /LENGTH=276 /DNA_ID=CAMNT_0039081105 /DNA_START=28 /DNA_END=858 /DNA_ORIENTATION=+
MTDQTNNGPSSATTAPSSEEVPTEHLTIPSDHETKKISKRWFPLESNPDLMNKYIDRLGWDSSGTDMQYKFVDVFSTEPWAIEMIGHPVASVIFLYKITSVQEEHRMKEASEIEKNGQTLSPRVWHTIQRIGNACGTIGLLHALANVPDGLSAVSIRPDSWLDRFYSAATDMDGISRAELLETDGDIEKMHESATRDEANQTGRGTVDDRVTTHFICFTHVDGNMYELDGRKKCPINHGPTDEMGLLKNAMSVVKNFMERDPNEVHFTILALAPTN